VNKISDSTRTASFTTLALGGLAVMITALAAAAAYGQVRERFARTPALESGRRISGTMVSQVEDAVKEASGRVSASQAQGTSGVLRASMDPWAGPGAADERLQLPRRLSSEERLLLRQEIQRATEEVYGPYRRQKN